MTAAPPRPKPSARSPDRKALVAASGLFDPDWYLATYRDVAEAGLDPLQHYCVRGGAEHRMPNAYFDTVWFRARAGIADETDALLAYIAKGERQGIAPGPHFDPVWYRTAYGLKGSASPLAHFLAHRRDGKFAPAAHLWSVARRSATPDGEADPFLPFLTAGRDAVQDAAPDISALRSGGLFDENYYQLLHDDVVKSGMDSLTHYCAFGWQEGRNPSLYFNARWYSATNPEVGRLRVNPLVHYLLAGEPADRRPTPFFEPGWYRATYGLAPEISPLAHYLARRRTQLFSPNALFDPDWYLRHCGLPLRTGQDLFAHYLFAGMSQDLRPSEDFDAAVWRQRTRGRRSRHFRQALSLEADNPLVNYMLLHYR